MGKFIRPSDPPKLRESFSLFILSLPLRLPISVFNCQLLLNIFGLNFLLPTLASKQSYDPVEGTCLSFGSLQEKLTYKNSVIRSTFVCHVSTNY